MYISPEDFIATTLARTLPHLLAACDVKVIEAIGKALNSKPSTLLLNHFAEILSHLFLLRGAGETDKAIACLLKVLMDSANKKMIDAHSVVKSSIVQLIAQLVIVMGDENPDTAASVSSLLAISAPMSISFVITGHVCPKQSRARHGDGGREAVKTRFSRIFEDIHAGRGLLRQRAASGWPWQDISHGQTQDIKKFGTDGQAYWSFNQHCSAPGWYLFSEFFKNTEEPYRSWLRFKR
jgi:hypothetical protein